MSAILGATWLAACAERAALRGPERDADPDVAAYAAAQAQVLEHFNVHGVTRTLHLQKPHLRVNVVEVPGDGPPVLLVHGGGSTLISWAPLLPELRGRHLFLVDRPGCGLTDGFDYVDVDLHEHAVEFMTSVMDALSLERAEIVGNSMGGLFSIWFALAHPERVEALALVGCPALWPGTSGPMGHRLLTLPGIGSLMLGMQPTTAEALRSNFARMAGEKAAAKIDPVMIEAAARAQRIAGARRSFRTLSSSVLTVSGVNDRYALTDADIARLPARVLLVWGKHDFYGAPPTTTLPLTVIDGGHLPWIDEPELVGRALTAFLAAR